MSKADQLIEYTTQDIIAYIVEDTGIDLPDAMHRFYTSKTYEKLMDKETGLYLESPAYVYSLFVDEKDGVIVQNEI